MWSHTVWRNPTLDEVSKGRSASKPGGAPVVGWQFSVNGGKWFGKREVGMAFRDGGGVLGVEIR